jgi:hypothetical protein
MAARKSILRRQFPPSLNPLTPRRPAAPNTSCPCLLPVVLSCRHPGGLDPRAAMVGQQALSADSKRLLELLPTRGTLRYFFWLSLGT